MDRMVPLGDPREAMRAASILERVLKRLDEGDVVLDEALARLAHESFAAGFAAGASRASGRADTDRAAERDPSPSPVRIAPTPSPHSPARVAFAPPPAGPASRAESAPAPARPFEPSDPVGALSPRRFEVLRLVARGLTNREIARVLGISANTVKAHLAGVLEALDLSNRTEAAVAFQEYENARSARDSHHEAEAESGFEA